MSNNNEIIFFINLLRIVLWRCDLGIDGRSNSSFKNSLSFEFNLNGNDGYL